MEAGAELLPGTLDLLILKAVSLGRLHGHGGSHCAVALGPAAADLRLRRLA